MEWPEHIPNVIDSLGREKLQHSIDLVPVLPLDEIEARSRRFLRCMGGLASTLNGSQDRYRFPYYTEMFVHEWAHMLLLGADGPRCLEEESMKKAFLLHARRNAREEVVKTYADLLQVQRDAVDFVTVYADLNENEVETAATTTLVLELMGLTYDRWALVHSTTTNLVGKLWLMAEVYPQMREARSKQQVLDVAMRIAARLTKTKLSQLEVE